MMVNSHFNIEIVSISKLLMMATVIACSTKQFFENPIMLKNYPLEVVVMSDLCKSMTSRQLGLLMKELTAVQIMLTNYLLECEVII